jgi:Glycosyl hydrolase family 115/Gylcosyl hydrolase family 115 C-terminal domain
MRNSVRIAIRFPRFLLILAAAAFAGAVPPAAAAAASLTLFDGGSVAAIAYDKRGDAPFENVAALLAHDLTALTGRTPAIGSDPAGAEGPTIIIGLASSPEIAALLGKNGISSTPIDGKWEAYGRAVVPAPGNPGAKALVIFGSDVRGTIWGVIDLTREMGVSAWQWWADVRIRKVDRIAVDGSLRYSKPPSVRYRGIFLNAGDRGLNPWASKTHDPEFGNIGPKTYARIYQLMWRLKANTIWPAMTEADAAFNTVPGNYELARDYAIVRSSSHVEMLLRNNTAEWDEDSMGPYNWILNKQRLIGYWRGAIEKFGQFENLYTVGMRNRSDFPMQGVKSPDELAKVLTDVIAEQRKILSNVLQKPAREVPQLFTPYKEVLAAYDTGHLVLPQDITIDWPDDNFGYIMRLSNAAERARPGGAGIYYHLVFWGRPMGTLWVASTDPSLMWEEMSRAYHFDARSFWILNVGSIKPCEFLTEFFLAMAFDTDAFADPKSVRAYLDDWAGRNFGPEHRDAIAGVMWQYYKLAFDRNPEFMAWSTTFPLTPPTQTEFNILDFGDENARRAHAYASLIADAAALAREMPADRKDAFYELVQYTVNIGANLNLRQLALDKSIAYGLQHRASANAYASRAKAAQLALVAEAQRYNEQTADGKWRYFMVDTPRDLPAYEAPHIPDWTGSLPGTQRCGVQVEGGGYFDSTGWYTPTLPLFHRELGDRNRYIDIFTEEPADAAWRAEPSEPWIRVDRGAGNFSLASGNFEQRIRVTVDWATAPKEGEGTVTITCSAGQQPIPVHVRLAPPATSGDASFIESAGVVSMYAPHADAISAGWRVLDGLGHTGADLQTDLDMMPVDPDDPAALARAPRLTYRFETFAPDRDYSYPVNITDETADIRAVALPTFPLTPKGGVRIAVSLDGGAPEVLDFSAEEYSSKWREGVLRNAAVAKLSDVHLNPGAHTLSVYALDPGVTLDRFEIRFRGAHAAYGPVPETRIRR